MMDVYKKEIKTWLKAHGKSREWLAEQCYVNKRTIDEWLSSRGVIPEAKKALIENILHPPAPQVAPGKISLGVSHLSLEIATEKLLHYQLQAQKSGMTLENWLISMIEYIDQHGEIMQQYVETANTGTSPESAGGQDSQTRQKEARRVHADEDNIIRGTGAASRQLPNAG